MLSASAQKKLDKYNERKVPGGKDLESAANKRFVKIASFLMEEGYLLGPKIGSGTHSKVRLVERIADTKDLAVKIIDTEKASEDYVQVFLPRELEALKIVKHENIAQVTDIFRKDKLVFFVMEYAEKGDLLEYLINNGAMDEDEARLVFQQIVTAVRYLHEAGIAHRDVKCENILLKKNGDILLTDFGFCRRLDKDKSLCKTFCGSAAYASPQLITATPYNPCQNDVWALGCILFILVCGSMPYDDSNIKHQLKAQLKGVRYPSKVRDKLNPDVKALIENILEPDTKKRYTIADIMNDKWYNETSEFEIADQAHDNSE